MKIGHWVAAVILALAGGCAPTRYAWSPDGSRMTVISDDGLRLADPSGHLLPPLINGVQIASWFPDSKQLAVVRDVPVGTWKELAPALTRPQVQEITQAASHARDAIFEYEWDAPDALDGDQFLKFVKERAAAAHRNVDVYDRLTIPIAIYLKDHRDEAMASAAPEQWWKQLDQLRQEVHQVELYRIEDQTPAPVATVMRTLADVVEVRPSPTGRNVLISTTAGDQACDLWVAPATGERPPIKVQGTAAISPDWSPDGRRLIFIAAVASPDGNQILGGTLSQLEVAGPDGALLPRFAPKQDLCAVGYSALGKVRCERDGRIIFAAAEATHGGPGDASQRTRLFVLDRPGAGSAHPLLPAAADAQLGDATEYFELNPDGTRVSIPDSQGRVCVADLGTGQVRVVQDQSMKSSSNQPGLISVPQWRSDDTLTLIAPGPNGQPTVVAWSYSTQKSVLLSAGWPAPLLAPPH